MKSFIICASMITLVFCVWGKDNTESLKNYYALVIGVDQYKNSQSGLSVLNFVNNDVAAIRELLLAQGWEEQKIKLITGKKATKKNLIAVLNGWLRQVDSKDILLVYWAGHGYPDLADQRRVYFACYDTDLKKPWTGYRMDKVVKSIKEHRIKNVIFVADTCHAGKIVTRSNGTKGLSIQPYLQDVPVNRNIPEGWVFFAATEAGYQTIENKKWKNGVFTYCFINAVKNNRTLNGIKNEIIKKVPLEAGKITNIPITPIVVTNSSDKKIWDITLNINR